MATMDDSILLKSILYLFLILNRAFIKIKLTTATSIPNTSSPSENFNIEFLVRISYMVDGERVKSFLFIFFSSVVVEKQNIFQKITKYFSFIDNNHLEILF